MSKIYWTTKDGSKIDVNEMSIEHLRNTLKMIIRKNQAVSITCPHNTSDAYDKEVVKYKSTPYAYSGNLMAFSDREVRALTHKSQYQQDNEDNMWK